ncbi:MAG: thioredoxin domain-containing protein [Rhodospirillales bacterium]|nr:thioredoxin domain-containing protein [Rhodospirillales bacterium]
MAAPLPPAPPGIKLTNAASPAIVVELFHDVCCPYSKKMYDTVHGSLLAELEARGLSGRIEFLWQSVPQPWHAQSCCMHDAVMAAKILDPGKAPAYIAAIYACQSEFFDDQIKDLSRVQLYARLAAIAADSGYDAPAFAGKLSLDQVSGNAGLGEVTQHLKWAVKYHRTRGVHTSPTVFINGIEAGDVSSGWGVSEWMEKLAPMLA